MRTISGKSSSSGSYSIGGSNPNVTESVELKTTEIKEIPEKTELKSKEDKVTSPMHEREQMVPKMTGSLSDDERSVHYSSSGYYESPVDDDDDGGLSKTKLCYLFNIKITIVQRTVQW